MVLVFVRSVDGEWVSGEETVGSVDGTMFLIVFCMWFTFMGQVCRLAMGAPLHFWLEEIACWHLGL